MQHIKNPSPASHPRKRCQKHAEKLTTTHPTSQPSDFPNTNHLNIKTTHPKKSGPKSAHPFPFTNPGEEKTQGHSALDLLRQRYLWRKSSTIKISSTTFLISHLDWTADRQIFPLGEIALPDERRFRSVTRNTNASVTGRTPTYVYGSTTTRRTEAQSAPDKKRSKSPSCFSHSSPLYQPFPHSQDNL